MIWIKGIMNYNGKEIINDDLWHSVTEENNQLYVDGKLRISQADIICDLLKECKSK